MSPDPTEQEPDAMDTTIDLSEIRQVSDVDLFEVWDRELALDQPVAPLVKAYELEAKRRGFDLPTVAAAMVASLSGAGKFDLDSHPRGMDGTFIEKLGIVDIVNFKTKSNTTGQEQTINKQRGQVTSITPDPKKPGQPDIKVVFKDPKTGKPTESIIVKPGNIKQAPQQKARLDDVDAPDAPKAKTPDDDGNKKIDWSKEPKGLGEGAEDLDVKTGKSTPAPDAKGDVAKPSAPDAPAKPRTQEDTLDQIGRDANELSVDDVLKQASDTGGDEGTVLLSAKATNVMNELADEALAIKGMDANDPEMAGHQAAIKQKQDDINRLLSQMRDMNGGEDTGPPIDWETLTNEQLAEGDIPDGGNSTADWRKPAVANKSVAAKPSAPAKKSTAGGGTAAKRAASGATVQDGQVVGANNDVKLLDGSDAKPGSAVKFPKDGSSRTIVGDDPKNPNYVRVRLTNGKTVLRSKRTMTADTENPLTTYPEKPAKPQVRNAQGEVI